MSDPMSDSNLELALDQLVGISRRAGAAILDWYDGDMGITQKADNTPLTKADLASHDLISTELTRLWPEIPVLSEESADIPWVTRQSWQRYWLVDPLDGTREFINHNDEFTVNIALIKDHQPVLGIVYVPVTGICYFGAGDYGAWRQKNEDPATAIEVRQPAAEPAVIVGSRSHANPELASQLNKLGPHELISMGSSLKFCRVAEGLADFYPRIGPTSEWDTAAAQAVVEAAGGQVVKIDGTPLGYNTREAYLNPYFFVFGDPAREWLWPFQDSSH
ncbi:MAG: 3'(2'),5'-bisphosphate nucleotidase CysQ [Gammaproteobacteria bacterium]|nr:MAG: 3'(2'),5'-bisphosphate nucleotidase CysQ [Gammaproteobacteria bacterium]